MRFHVYKTIDDYYIPLGVRGASKKRLTESDKYQKIEETLYFPIGLVNKEEKNLAVFNIVDRYIVPEGDEEPVLVRTRLSRILFETFEHAKVVPCRSGELSKNKEDLQKMIEEDGLRWSSQEFEKLLNGSLEREYKEFKLSYPESVEKFVSIEGSGLDDLLASMEPQNILLPLLYGDRELFCLHPPSTVRQPIMSPHTIHHFADMDAETVVSLFEEWARLMTLKKGDPYSITPKVFNVFLPSSIGQEGSVVGYFSKDLSHIWRQITTTDLLRTRFSAALKRVSDHYASLGRYDIHLKIRPLLYFLEGVAPSEIPSPSLKRDVEILASTLSIGKKKTNLKSADMERDLLELFEEELVSMSLYDKNGLPKYDRTVYLNNIKKFIKAVKENRKIVVYGDYDVDGILSSTMIYAFIKSVRENLFRREANVEVVFSDRNAGFGMDRITYESILKRGDFLIVSDTGSEIDFFDSDTTIVLDHHPTSRARPHLINPNVDNETPYLTSGGAVVYDFLDNVRRAMEKMLKNVGSDIRVVTENLSKLLIEFRGVTLVSDMALLTKSNRAMIRQALESISDDPVLPMFYATLRLEEDVTSTDLSFGVISKINGYSRMGEDLSILKEWIIPSKLDLFEMAHKKIMEAHRAKMTLVSSVVKNYFDSADMGDLAAKPFHLLRSDNTPHGLNGLVANKLYQRFGTPTFVVSPIDEKRLVGSARGPSAKKILERVFAQLGSDTFGGHDEASGFTVEKSQFDRFVQILDEVVRHFDVEPDLGLFTNSPVSLGTFLKMESLYRDYARGVGFYKTLSVPVAGFRVEGVKVYRSGYANVSITDGEGSRFSFFVDTVTTPLQSLENSVAIFSFDPKSASLKTAMDRETYNKIVLEPSREKKRSLQLANITQR